MRKLFFAILFVIVFANPKLQASWEDDGNYWVDESYWTYDPVTSDWSYFDSTSSYTGNDFDTDDVPDIADNCPMIANTLQEDLDGDGLGNVCDPNPNPHDDEDNDGVPDAIDLCPGHADNVDTDGDGTPNDCDACPADATNDSDGDGLCADVDSCPTAATNDADHDGMCGDVDVCPLDAANDADGDGFCESNDNCPTVANTNQSDVDGDSIGDACEPDDDGDDVIGDFDNCPLDANADQADADGDGTGDVCDADEDNDGVPGDNDVCLGTPLSEPVLATGCSIDQQCQCNAPWKNQGAYVSCVAHASNAVMNAGQITQAEKDAIMAAAGQSSCGKKK